MLGFGKHFVVFVVKFVLLEVFVVIERSGCFMVGELSFELVCVEVEFLNHGINVFDMIL